MKSRFLKANQEHSNEAGPVGMQISYYYNKLTDIPNMRREQELLNWIENIEIINGNFRFHTIHGTKVYKAKQE